MSQTPDSDNVAGARPDLLCDLDPLGVLRLEGPDAEAFLQGQLSSDVRRLAAGRWQPTTYNSPKGRMLANFPLWRDAEGYGALLPRDLLAPVRKRLAMFVLRSKVTLHDATDATRRWGLAGSGAAAAVAAALGEAPQPGEVLAGGNGVALCLASTRYIVLAPAAHAGGLEALLAAHAARGDYAVWQRLMIQAAIPTITAATQDLFVPQMANMDALGAISFDKGCYTGQEIVARTQYLGRLKERLYVWHASVTDVEPGTRLYSVAFEDQACGTVVNAAPGREGGTDLLAVVQVAARASGDVHLGSLDGPPLAPRELPYALPSTAEPPRRQ